MQEEPASVQKPRPSCGPGFRYNTENRSCEGALVNVTQMYRMFVYQPGS